MLPLAWFILGAIAHQTPRPIVLEHRAYVQASLFASVRPASRCEINRIDHNLSGATAAVSIAGGAMVSPTIGFEGEFVYGGTISAPQSYHYSLGQDYTAENQQFLANALLRYRPQGTTRVEFVGGGGYGRSIDRHTGVTTVEEFVTRFPAPDSISGRNALTLTGGMDFRLSVASRTAIVPGFRVRWVKPLPEGYYISGAGAWTIEFGAGVRVQ